MSKASKKQIKITTELIATCTHSLGELGLPFALNIEGVDHVFTNTSRRHALAIMRDSLELQDSIDSARLTEKVEKLTESSIPVSDEDADDDGQVA